MKIRRAAATAARSCPLAGADPPWAAVVECAMSSLDSTSVVDSVWFTDSVWTMMDTELEPGSCTITPVALQSKGFEKLPQCSIATISSQHARWQHCMFVTAVGLVITLQ